MINFQNLEDYKSGFTQSISLEEAGVHTEVINYFKHLLNQMDSLICSISKDNFWETIPKIVGIDSKLVILESFLEIDIMEEMSAARMLAIIENDYSVHNRELCGYYLNKKPHHSLLFNVK